MSLVDRIRERLNRPAEPAEPAAQTFASWGSGSGGTTSSSARSRNSSRAAAPAPAPPIPADRPMPISVLPTMPVPVFQTDVQPGAPRPVDGFQGIPTPEALMAGGMGLGLGPLYVEFDFTDLIKK
jgi:hypothetical protein